MAHLDKLISDGNRLIYSLRPGEMGDRYSALPESVSDKGEYEGADPEDPNEYTAEKIFWRSQKVKR